MKKTLLIKFALVVIAGVGVAMPGRALAIDATAQKSSKSTSAVQDVKLTKNGTLVGYVVDHQGRVQAEQTVRILQGKNVVAELKTDDKGRFKVDGIKGGVYQIQSAKGEKLYRAWADGTAPKSSQEYAVVSTAKPVVRGQEEVLGFFNVSNLGGAALLGGATGFGIYNAVEASEKRDDARAAEARAAALQRQIDMMNQTP